MLVVEAYKEDLATTLSKSKLTIGIGSTALYILLFGIKTIFTFQTSIITYSTLQCNLSI